MHLSFQSACHTQVTFVTTPCKIWLTPPLSFECLRWNMNECVHWRLELFRYEYVKYFLRVVALQLCISLFPLPPSLPLPSVTSCGENFASGPRSWISKEASERENTMTDKNLDENKPAHTLHFTGYLLEQTCTIWRKQQHPPAILCLTNRQADVSYRQWHIIHLYTGYQPDGRQRCSEGKLKLPLRLSEVFSHATAARLWGFKCMSAGRSAHRFGPVGNITTTIGWITVIFMFTFMFLSGWTVILLVVLWLYLQSQYEVSICGFD